MPLLDLALWLADFPEPVRVSAHMDRPRGAGSVEDGMVVAYLTDPHGSLFALFSPRLES